MSAILFKDFYLMNGRWFGENGVWGTKLQISTNVWKSEFIPTGDEDSNVRSSQVPPTTE